MSAGKKILYVIIVVGATVCNYAFLIAMWPTIRQFIGIAQADPVLSGPAAGNFTLYSSAIGSAPIYLFILPAVVSVIEVIMILHASEIVATAKEVYGEIRNR